MRGGSTLSLICTGAAAELASAVPYNGPPLSRLPVLIGSYVLLADSSLASRDPVRRSGLTALQYHLQGRNEIGPCALPGPRSRHFFCFSSPQVRWTVCVLLHADHSSLMKLLRGMCPVFSGERLGRRHGSSRRGSYPWILSWSYENQHKFVGLQTK